MTFVIPTWALWALGIGIGLPVVVVILLLAYVGAMFCWSLRNGIW